MGILSGAMNIKRNIQSYVEGTEIKKWIHIIGG